MKTTLFTFVLLAGLSFSTTSFAQKFEDIFSKYRNIEGIEVVKMNDVTSITGMISENQNPLIQKIAKQTTSLFALVSRQSKEDLDMDVKNYIEKKKLEELFSTSKNGEKFQVYTYGNKDEIQEIVAIITVGAKHLVLNVNGKYPRKDIQEIAGEITKELNTN